MIRFTTLTGSVYEVDKDAMTWARVKETTESGFVRTSGGTLVKIPEIKIGYNVVMDCPPIIEGTTGRLIITSQVMQIEIVNKPNAMTHGYSDLGGYEPY